MEMAIRPKWSNAHWTLLFIILTPIAVVLLASFIFFSRWGLPEGTRNQGELLASPIDVSEQLSIKRQTEFFGKQSNNPWHFAVVVPDVCDAACENSLWFVRQVRVALGKYQGSVDNTVLTIDSVLPLPLLDKYQPITQHQIDQQLLLKIRGQHQTKPEHVNFYLIDPQGLVMMVYEKNHSHQQIIKDMKFLFKGVE